MKKPFQYLSLSFFSLLCLNALIFNNANAQKVGINTTQPTANLHTVGTVRLQGISRNNALSRVIMSDANGNLSWKDQDSIYAYKAWSLQGNNITANDFFGTINNQRLIIKANNIEQLTILPNGNIGAGVMAPDRKMVLYNSNISNNNELVLKQGISSQLGAYLVLDNTANTGGKYWSIGSAGPLNTAGQLGATGSLEFYQLDAGDNERSRMMITPLGYVGINTVPSARFHVKGDVRFQGLPNNNSYSRIAVMDANGNLAWKDETTLPSSSNWSLTGNVATITSFIGTTNVQPVVVKTAGIERMRILANGYVGIGTTNPDRMVVVQNTNASNNNELVLKQVVGSQLGSYIVLDNTANPGGKYWSIGSSGPSNTAGQFGAPGSLEFYQLDAGPLERARMMITPQGYVGINTVPQARLHVKGTVRLENLPTGSGTVLIINENGDLMRSSIQTSKAKNNDYEINSLKLEIEALKAEVKELAEVVKQLKEQSK